jgi:hypothetical protein
MQLVFLNRLVTIIIVFIVRTNRPVVFLPECLPNIHSELAHR